MRSFRAQKAALTRAQNSGDPRAIIAECVRFIGEYEDAGAPWPDDWHRWNIAYGDARRDLRQGYGHDLRDIF